MSLPERARQYLDRLIEFVNGPSLSHFRNEAEKEAEKVLGYLSEERSMQFLDYACFLHRDRKGRTAVNLFLTANKGSLTEEECGVFQGFRNPSFGFLVVETIERGRGVAFRKAGTDERLEVVDVLASENLKVGEALVAVALPYRGHFELGMGALKYPSELAYVIDRAIRRRGKPAAVELDNYLELAKLLRSGSNPVRRPENQVEAEILAASVFAQVGVSLKIEDLQRRFQDITDPMEVFRDLGSFNFRDKQALDMFGLALTELWNHTPRDEFKGMTPDEKHQEGLSMGMSQLPDHLIQDLMDETISKAALHDFPDDDARRCFLEEVKNEWLSRPQRELGGLSPRDLLSRSALGMDSPCPCGSGKKFGDCCGG